MCKHTKIVPKEYEHKVYDFHCAECGAWIPPDDIVRRWNAVGALSEEDAIGWANEGFNDALKLILREYARILRGEDETE